MEWIALKHALLSHLPVATGLLLPWALLASQRSGRGIRPWWTVCRYLGWAGLLGYLAATLSGYAAARLGGLIPPGRLLPLAASGMGADALLFRHAVLTLATLPVGIAAVWAMNRPRKDHQSLGLTALALGLAWSALLLLAGEGGYNLAHNRQASHRAPLAAAAPPAVAPVVADPEAKAPLRALDFAGLEAIHGDPVKSSAHGGRWVRAWANAVGASAYRAGQPLPVGSFVVLSSLEDRWGRPSTEPGPLYALEVKASGPSLTFYWPRVPVERRRETGGEAHAYWRGADAQLESCRTCHGGGMADPTLRSRWRVPRRVPAAE